MKLETFPTTIDLFNNRHTIEQRYEDGVSRIFFDGIWYDLKQFHFHTLSEHAVQSEHGVMEMHAVLGAGDLNLVVGVLFEIGYYVNPFIQKLIDAGLPQTTQRALPSHAVTTSGASVSSERKASKGNCGSAMHSQSTTLAPSGTRRCVRRGI